MIFQTDKQAKEKGETWTLQYAKQANWVKSPLTVTWEVIINATSWMERKYRDAPSGKIAAMIALHYLMLAIRNEYRAKPQAIEEHIARALH